MTASCSVSREYASASSSLAAGCYSGQRSLLPVVSRLSPEPSTFVIEMQPPSETNAKRWPSGARAQRPEPVRGQLAPEEALDLALKSVDCRPRLVIRQAPTAHRSCSSGPGFPMRRHAGSRSRACWRRARTRWQAVQRCTMPRSGAPSSEEAMTGAARRRRFSQRSVLECCHRRLLKA